jgi:hypothetical protein
MEEEKNISGISDNLADSIVEHASEEKVKTKKGTLQGKHIAISVSKSEELEYLGLSENHIKDLSIELARYLLVNKGKLLYGGDLRNDGYTEIFAELSYQYKYLHDRENMFVNYFPFPNFKALTTSIKAQFHKQQVEPKIIAIPDHLDKVDIERTYSPNISIEDRFIFAECFADMRIKMAEASDARIVLGGKQKGFMGYLSGVVEETYHALKANNAVYLVGGFGGAAKSIIEVIKGNTPEQLTNDFQFDTAFLSDFKKLATQNSTVELNYEIITQFFKDNTIESLSKRNGLEVWENEILFESTNIHEIVFLIIKGLQKI